MFTYSIRVYYEDTDSGSIVYYANYLKFLERARTEWFRSFDIENSALAESENIIMVVSHVEIDYISPARLDDLLTVSVNLLKASAATLELQQLIDIDDKIICSANIKLACIDASRFKPVRIPKPIIKLITQQPA